MPDEIVTLVPDVGTPPHQFKLLFHEVLTKPSHVPGALMVSVAGSEFTVPFIFVNTVRY